MAITDFRKDYFFLSNFYPCHVEFDGLTYLSSEAAFQAQKTIDPRRRKFYTELSAKDAKASGMIESLRIDWEKVKLGIMYDVNYAKFTQDTRLKNRLLETGDEHLEEGNKWGDKFWGTVKGVGENHLGKILMEVRERIRKEENHYAEES